MSREAFLRGDINGMTRIEKIAHFQMKLKELADLYGYDVAEAPHFSYDAHGTHATGSGIILWPVYDNAGQVSNELMARFIPKINGLD